MCRLMLPPFILVCGTVVIDEVQRRPELFPVLRVLADRKPTRARFLVLSVVREPRQATGEVAESVQRRGCATNSVVVERC